MRNLTVAAAALAAGVMTFAAHAQEAPTLTRPEATKSTPKNTSKKTITVSIGPEFQTYPVGPVVDLGKEVDKMVTGSIVKPDLKPKARKQESVRKHEKKAAATGLGRKRVRKAGAVAAAARSNKGSGMTVPADNQDRELAAAASAVSRNKSAGMIIPADNQDREMSAEAGQYHAIINLYASSYGVPVSLAHAVIRVESNYRVDARGSAGEVGLMQIKPATARMMGYSGSIEDLFNPETNIKYGMKYLGLAHQLGGGATCQTILKYNAGHAAKRMNPISAAYCSKVKRQLGGS